jgi:hypothetical protein
VPSALLIPIAIALLYAGLAICHVLEVWERVRHSDGWNTHIEDVQKIHSERIEPAAERPGENGIPKVAKKGGGVVDEETKPRGGNLNRKNHGGDASSVVAPAEIMTSKDDAEALPPDAGARQNDGRNHVTAGKSLPD